jgi:CRP/FNR family transcriptional regulator
MTKDIHLHTCLADLTEPELELFRNKKTQITYEKGETIIKQGAFSTHVLFINDGLVKTSLQSPGQKRINLRLVNSGEFIALFSIFDTDIYPFTVVALKQTVVCMIDKTALAEVMRHNSGFLLEMTSRNYQKEHRYLDIINSLSFNQMRGKLATTLLYLSSVSNEYNDAFDYLTRQMIADFSSITLESTIKFIKEFEREGILKLDNKKIVITDKAKLEEISLVG